MCDKVIDMSANQIACLREVRGIMKENKFYKSLEIVRRRTSYVITFAGGIG